MLKKLITHVLIFAAATSLIFTQTGCDRLRSAAKASARISRQIDNLVIQNRESFEGGLYGRDTALDIAEITGRMIPAAKAFNAMVGEIKATYPGGKDVPRAKWTELVDLFARVEAVFAELLVVYGKLAVGQAAKISMYITAIQEAIGLIRDTFDIAAKGGDQWTQYS